MNRIKCILLFFVVLLSIEGCFFTHDDISYKELGNDFYLCDQDNAFSITYKKKEFNTEQLIIDADIDSLFTDSNLIFGFKNNQYFVVDLARRVTIINSTDSFYNKYKFIILNSLH